ncbi:CPBP family intramembrane metalloprotease [Cytobacillus spongiae]|jgi:membrane protease YdiL (CAAX protease family)|uniref:CPBP family intramembrane glutamic endopeptidase n=1 Tax=Cytobacillus spongiae TaxID=2901381 RepID=UPI001F40D288|nr:type II CAAX endopeptidase family protein [Cytobacillus spongiae]UII57190.1 CPBP family intramembrane metalloprotease [Cytobacillus spongiae]
MKKCAYDLKLVGGFLLAHLLLYFSFQDKNIFWYIFTASLLILISYSILIEQLEDKASFSVYIIYGVVSGALLYGLFWTGYSLLDFLNLPFLDDVSKLYNRFAPSLIWHYIVLLLVIIPGEEIFWRGFIQKRIVKHTNVWIGIIVSALLYSSAHLYSGYPILALAALVAGIFWGILFAWKRSLPMVIVSHLIFDLLLFVVLPLQ